MPQKDLVNKVKDQESTISTILGVLVVIVVGYLLFRYFKGTPAFPPPTSEKTESVTPTQSPEAAATVPQRSPVSLPTTYKVVKNDSLWKISERYYGTGFNWKAISNENNLKNPSILFIGQELKIPQLAQTITQKTQTSFGEPITGNSYQVVKGDNLWKISVRAYQDGFKWVQIAKANKLTSPGIIHPGNVLTIPR